MPGKRPKWLPKWIWRENCKAMEEENVYGAQEGEDNENANENGEYYDYYSI